MGRRRSGRSEPGGRQIIQVQQMFQNLLLTLDTAGVQRILAAREVLSALADGRLTPKKALCSLGVPVALADGTIVTMDLFGLRKEVQENEALEAFERQGLRPATDEEFKSFCEHHPDAVHDLLVRGRLNMVVMGKKVRLNSRNPREVCWGYPTYSRNHDCDIQRYVECVDCTWDKSYRFLGVRIDTDPGISVVPMVSARHLSPKVRPSA